MYERFDKFKMSYNLLGNKQLRDLLMRSDNFMGGRYFAELIKGRVFKQMEKVQLLPSSFPSHCLLLLL